MNSLVVKYYIEGAENRILERRLTPHDEENIDLAMNFLAKSYEEGAVIVLMGAHNFNRERRFVKNKTCRYCMCRSEVWEKVIIPDWPKDKWKRFEVVSLPGVGQYARLIDA